MKIFQHKFEILPLYRYALIALIPLYFLFTTFGTTNKNIRFTIKNAGCKSLQIYTDLPYNRTSHEFNLKNDGSTQILDFTAKTTVNAISAEQCKTNSALTIVRAKVAYFESYNDYTNDVIGNIRCIDCIASVKDNEASITQRDNSNRIIFEPTNLNAILQSSRYSLGTSLSQYTLILLILLLVLPLFFALFKSDIRYLFIEALFYTVIMYWLYVFSVYKNMKNFFPYPKIDPTRSIGHTQFYGYPFNYDTAAYALFILIPVFCVSLALIRVRLAKK